MNPWSQTFRGIPFDLLEPKAEMLRIEDIAHSLAKQDRYNGHARTFYPVAQHSLLCARLVALWGFDLACQFDALMHDAHEAYIGDTVSPMKKAMREILHKHEVVVEPHEEVERRIDLCLRQHFGMTVQIRPSSVRADLVMLACEKKFIITPCEREWFLPEPADTRLEASDFEEQHWTYWRDEFIATFNRLKPPVMPAPSNIPPITAAT